MRGPSWLMSTSHSGTSDLFVEKHFFARKQSHHGHVAIVPLRVAAAPSSPHATTQLAPTQLVTVQPVDGHVTWQSLAPPQSTLHVVASPHST